MEETNQVPEIRLISAKPEVGNIMTFIFETGGLSWIPGQFQRYTLPQAGTTEEETKRWFTISAAPSEGVIRISTRITESKFKQTLKALKPGDMVQREGIEGDFTWEEEPSNPVVLVAGGIGVTPYRSILLERDARGKKLNATLLYFNRSDEIPFLEEFKVLAEKHPEFTLVTIVGESITAENILTHVPNAEGVTYYLSGPEPMVEAIGTDLIRRGINLKQDWFPGYDEQSY
jgi:ferredoxin-NADP reductase